MCARGVSPELSDGPRAYRKGQSRASVGAQQPLLSLRPTLSVDQIRGSSLSSRSGPDLTSCPLPLCCRSKKTMHTTLLKALPWHLRAPLSRWRVREKK